MWSKINGSAAVFNKERGLDTGSAIGAQFLLPEKVTAAEFGGTAK